MRMMVKGRRALRHCYAMHMGRGENSGSATLSGASLRANSQIDEGVVTLSLWHGSRNGRLGTIRPGFFATSCKSEAEDYACVDEDLFDEEDRGAVFPVAVTLRRPKRYQGHYPGPQSPEFHALRRDGYDGAIIDFAADDRDASSPLPPRTWVYVFDSKAVSVSN